MTSSLAVRQAGHQDLETVMQLLTQRIAWLRAKGSDQWSTWEQWHDKIPATLNNDQVWLLLDGDEPIGTVTVELRGDSDFWTPQECAEPAAYLSKLAVRTDRAGAELGALLTEWAGEFAYRRGCTYLRLDAWKANEQLHDYYRRRGWTYLRTVTNPQRNSGALFQRIAVPMPFATAARLTQPPLTTLQAEARSGYTRGSDSRLGPAAGNWTPGHTHDGGITVIESWSPDPRPAMFVDFLRYRLRRGPDGWELETRDGGRLWHSVGWVVDAVLPLADGMDFVISHEG
ncbi:GNAT family N-acetyltransferase, partial [Dactylosporangium sp. CA-152071]|uniref:GNAT family N-acetyltransferase n=1 Tax=Dactylosporangium sp. CA-152071 TaxID=3239933 RepID=UPI003D9305D6